MDEPLTKLQQVILELETHDLPLRDKMRLATQRVGFFIGQQRYEAELRKAREKLARAGR
ncbi:MAG: hypothetical protein HY690_13505 [Chloroflexi bacterium]|nr:hypothetical protein [Chloroflexota bacterium]